MDYKNLGCYLRNSILEQEEKFKNTLILNPVENIPFSDILPPCASYMHGLYNTDTVRDYSKKLGSKLQFSGRDKITEDIQKIYEAWSELIKAKCISMRLLSGLHAHTVLFMGLTSIGDRVMVLPEKAGGHMSGRAILERLGLVIKDIPYCIIEKRVDQEQCVALMDEFKPDILFLDRSEGLVYEDFTWLCNKCHCYKIFDASQYLTNIICKDYKNPFDMGFDLIISTLHKNLPGPQRAMLCSRINDVSWQKLKSKISTYVSNMHVFSIYSAGLILEHMEELQYLSRNMIDSAILLEEVLVQHGVPVITRPSNAMATHHCWIKPESQQDAFDFFLTLERLGLLTNYRLLPYDLGYGIRLGLSGAIQSGLRLSDIPELGILIATGYHEGYSPDLMKSVTQFIWRIKNKTVTEC